MAVKITFSNFLLLSVFVAMGSLASANSIDCAGPGVSQVTVPDVTVLAPDTCSVIGSDLIFSNFGVNATDFSTPVIGIADPSDGTEVIGSDTHLAFQVTGADTGIDDTFLTYEASGGVLALDMHFEALPFVGDGSVTVTEMACSVAFAGNACAGTTYADFSATSICVSSTCTDASTAKFLVDGAANPVYVQDDIALNGANVTLLENSLFASAASPVPEPALAPLMAASLLGFGLLRLLFLHFRRKPPVNEN
jgi:hypothetical protein